MFNQQLNIGGASPEEDLGDENTLNGALIKDMVIRGNRTQLCTGIRFEQCDKLKLENVYIYGIKGTSIDIDTCREYTLDGVRTRFNGDRQTQRPDVRMHSDNPANEDTNFAHTRGCFFIYPLWSQLEIEDAGAMSISGGLMLHGIPIGTTEKGSHDGLDNASVLTDTSKSFAIDGLVGQVIHNITDGSYATITSNTATTITAALTGGTDNNWDIGDEYAISGDAANAKVFYEGEFGNTVDIDDYFNTYYQTGGAIESHLLDVSNGTFLQADHIKFYAGARTPVLVDNARLNATNLLLNGSDKRNGADQTILCDGGTVNATVVYVNNAQKIFTEANGGTVSLENVTTGIAYGNAQVDTGSATVVDYGGKVTHGSWRLNAPDGNGNPRTVRTVGSGNNVRMKYQQGFVTTLGIEPFNSAYEEGDMWAQNGAVRTHTNNGTKYVGTKTNVPPNAVATGSIGDWAVDATYVYFYTGDGATHSWVRTAVATW